MGGKSNGKWRYFRDRYNSDRPMPAPPAAESASKAATRISRFFAAGVAPAAGPLVRN